MVYTITVFLYSYCVIIMEIHQLELLSYLKDNFYDKQTLLAKAQISETELLQLQQKQLMPKASYKLELAVNSHSFFGTHLQTEHLEYYAKGYASWLSLIQDLKSKSKVYQAFYSRYSDRIKQLKAQGHQSNANKVNEGLEQHIAEEWQHFLAGTYGLCTKSGLPEDIANKELAILEIEQLTNITELTEQDLKRLTKAVNLLDEASALFAPHERAASSRRRLIDNVREQYKL